MKSIKVIGYSHIIKLTRTTKAFIYLNKKKKKSNKKEWNIYKVGRDT